MHGEPDTRLLQPNAGLLVCRADNWLGLETNLVPGPNWQSVDWFHLAGALVAWAPPVPASKVQLGYNPWSPKSCILPYTHDMTGHDCWDWGVIPSHLKLNVCHRSYRYCGKCSEETWESLGISQNKEGTLFWCTLGIAFSSYVVPTVQKTGSSSSAEKFSLLKTY